jgi:hypothetical protein
MTDFPYEQAQTFWTRKDETENKISNFPLGPTLEKR